MGRGLPLRFPPSPQKSHLLGGVFVEYGDERTRRKTANTKRYE